MSCDRAQLAISARMDGQPLGALTVVELDEHVAGCERCRTFASTAERVRSAVRIGPAEPVPDLVSQIVGELGVLAPPERVPAPSRPHRVERRWRGAIPIAAALVAGLVVGSVLVGGPFRVHDRSAVSANAVVQGVREAGPAIDSFYGTFSVVERGLSPEVPVRRLEVHMAFLAPQRFRLDVVDHTVYPASAVPWTPSDLTVIQTATETFRSGPTGCPTGLEAAACPATRTTLTRGPTPTDLMVPVTTLGSADGVRVLGSGGGSGIVRLELTFARAQAMFPFLWIDDITGAGNLTGSGETWRPFYPGDRVEVELDTNVWVPRRITVHPSSNERRRAWELRFGLPVENPSAAILDVVAARVTTETPPESSFELPTAEPSPLSIVELAEKVGYRPATPTMTGDLVLASAIAPPGPAPSRSLLVYANGLDFLRVSERPGSHPALVAAGAAQVALPGGSTGFYTEASPGHGRRLAILGDDTTLLLETNLPRLDLVEIAGSIPVQGRPLP